AVQVVAFPGKAFLNMLKMMVLPLIGGSMIAGIVSLNEAGADSGRLAKVTFMYFFCTTVIAVVLGLVLVNVIQPGVVGALPRVSSSSASDQDAEPRETPDHGVLDTLLGVLLKVFPPNIVEACVDMNILGVLTFSIMFGAALAQAGEEGRPVVVGITAFNAVIMRMVLAILWIAPVGIACLIAGQIAATPNFARVLTSLLLYVFAVILGCTIHGFMILPAIYWGVTRKNPYTFARGVSQALATAFGTDSSSATLPVTILVCEKMGVSKAVTRFVLPLGATVNMNGTALYEA
ncbi:Sodium:dicarboxylate symporter, partial [Baffinella frigidus]